MNPNSQPHQHPINRVAYALDSSGSMTRHASRLVEVMEKAIINLKRETEELSQITRVSIYTFDDEPRCIVSDMDVLHLPSIRDIYRIGNMTDLVGAVHLGLDDLELFPTKYGRHANLFWVLTDGLHNPGYNTGYANRTFHKPLTERMAALGDNWTVAALVPDITGVAAAKRYGFAPGNIGQWDALAADGTIEMGASMMQGTSTYLSGRAHGIEGTRTIFTSGADAVNANTVKAARNLAAADPSEYQLVEVKRPAGWDPGEPLTTRRFAELTFGSYITGRVHYALTKPETIQKDKLLLVMNNETKEVFQGEGVRDLLGLPNVTQQVKPDFNSKFTIFVQSRSPQRHLVPGTPLIWWNTTPTRVRRF